jgi:dihydropteroate synthase
MNVVLYNVTQCTCTCSCGYYVMNCDIVTNGCRALRACSDLDEVLISVDTFHAEVAREAVLAGTDIVNDVSGGTLDPRMYAQV